jgi:hypothetical protein
MHSGITTRFDKLLKTGGIDGGSRDKITQLIKNLLAPIPGVEQSYRFRVLFLALEPAVSLSL